MIQGLLELLLWLIGAAFWLAKAIVLIGAAVIGEALIEASPILALLAIYFACRKIRQALA